LSGEQGRQGRRIPLKKTIPAKAGTHFAAISMFYVYLFASKPDGTLYIGTTSDLPRRVWEHKKKLVRGFIKRLWDRSARVV
jgi:hypothetical protein